MKIKFSILLMCLLLMVSLTGCSNSSNESANGATVTDETIFSPPEEDKGITGSWTAEEDEIIINRYFYGNGNLVTIEQDPEENTWVFLALWDETGEKIEVTEREAYHYDEDDGSWVSIALTEDQIKKASFDENTNVISIEEQLPNGILANFDYKRGTTTISIPKESYIIGIINDYLMQ